MSDHSHLTTDSPTFDPRMETYEQSYDAAATGSEIVIDAIRSVAEIAGISAVEMEPLGKSVDVDALSKTIETATANGTPLTVATVRIHEHDVTIGGGRIVIDPPADVHHR